MNLSEVEKKELEEGGMGEDIVSTSRGIGRKLQERQHWTTLTATNEAPAPIRIMLVGEVGAGKSSLGNVLLGNSSFETSGTSVSVTHLCQEAGGVYGEEGREFVVVDTLGCAFMESTDKGTESGALPEIKSKMKSGVDVFILVINNSYRRSGDLGVKRLYDTQVLTSQSIKHFMVVGTHSLAHYSKKTAATFLHHVTDNTHVKDFMAGINNRVVLVELGTGSVTADAAMSGMAVYDKEREQARDMVMSMVYKVMKDNKGERYTPDVNSSFNKNYHLPSEIILSIAFISFLVAYKVYQVDAGWQPPATGVSISTINFKVPRLSAGYLLAIGKLGALKAAFM